MCLAIVASLRFVRRFESGDLKATKKALEGPWACASERKQVLCLPALQRQRYDKGRHDSHAFFRSAPCTLVKRSDRVKSGFHDILSLANSRSGPHVAPGRGEPRVANRREECRTWRRPSNDDQRRRSRGRLRNSTAQRTAGRAILGHGFPYDVHAYAEAAPILADAGARVIVPYLRGFGPTRFLVARDAALGRAGGARRRSAGADGRARHRARGSRRLRLGRPRRLRRLGAVAGARRRARLRQFLQHPGHRARDGAGGAVRGGRVLVPVLFPQRARPARPDEGPARRSRGSCGGCGRRPGPSTMRRSSARRRAFDNPDFVEVVIHSYRHRYGLVAGDPAYMRRSRRRSRRSRRSRSRRSRSTATPTA